MKIVPTDTYAEVEVTDDKIDRLDGRLVMVIENGVLTFALIVDANVIAADEGATSGDILALARLMRERVRLRLGVELEPEIRGLDVR